MAKLITPGSEGQRIVDEEKALLERVRERLRALAPAGEPGGRRDYDADLLELRDQVAEAKPEDVAPLVEQMARTSAIAARRGQSRVLPIDAGSPYFAHLGLVEPEGGGAPASLARRGGGIHPPSVRERRRDILIGRRGLIDRPSGVQIVDWRNAPISRIYYRYEEGDDYDETFPSGRMEGRVEARRNLAITGGVLRRIGCPQGTFISDARGTWFEAEGVAAPVLHGGQGTAARPPRSPVRRPATRGRLGVHGGPVPRADKRLPEIAALIDRHQFDLITRPSSGLVVIEGGAGSGKTTVALHRVAYLHYQDPRRFSPRNILVVVPTEALVRYVAGVLPALDVHGVPVVTARGWFRWARKRVVPRAPDRYADETPPVVERAKKHPRLLAALEDFARERKDEAKRTGARTFPSVFSTWAEFLTDRSRLAAALAGAEFSQADVAAVASWCTRQHDEPIEAFLATIDDPERAAPVDGGPLDDEGVAGRLDVEDDALLLRVAQIMRGGLSGRAGERTLLYEHLAIDEAQDLSVAEVKVLVEATTASRSVTLCGDVAQRFVFDNAFADFDSLLRDIGFRGHTVRPLGLSYRSSLQVMQFARAVLGPLAPRSDLRARPGEPVELHRFDEMGQAVAFVADALRSLMAREPAAQVAVLARHAAQADAWHAALVQAEVPSLRRVRRDEFPFKPGIDVTDVAQVKGLEFDYVLMVDATAASYPVSIEARHLLHVGATRAAHQLWLIAAGEPSPLVPRELCEQEARVA